VRHYEQQLSRRELEIATMAVEGVSTQQIAERMYLTINTVKTHLKHVFRKTGTENRNDLYRKLVTMQFPVLARQPVARDPLTGLLPPSAFGSLAETELADAVQHHPVSVIRMVLQGARADLPAVQEPLLIAMAGVFLTSVREGDLVFRTDDAEFVFLLPQCGPANARHIACRLAHKVQALAGGRNVALQVATGVASSAEGWRSAADLLRAAGEQIVPAGRCVS
jgi:DNA-binding CsgD family transcriptional regulator